MGSGLWERRSFRKGTDTWTGPDREWAWLWTGAGTMEAAYGRGRALGKERVRGRGLMEGRGFGEGRGVWKRPMSEAEL